MNRKAGLVMTLISITISTVVGGFITDMIMKNTLGIGLVDLYTIVTESTSTVEDAPSLEDVKLLINETDYNNLKEAKDLMDESFNTIGQNLDAVNQNQDVIGVLKAAFGEEYKIYMFSVTTIGNLTFKVFEWSIQINNGVITAFEDGKVLSEYNVNVQVDQSVISDLMSGQIDNTQVLAWVKNNMLKINPILEVTRLVNAMPQLINTLMTQVNK